MAHMIELKNGNMVPIFGYRDAMEIIQEEMGSDITDIVKEVVDDEMFEIAYQRDVAQEEKEECERMANVYTCVISEIRDIAEEMLDGFSDGKRPNRRELIKKLAYIKNIAHNAL